MKNKKCALCGSEKKLCDSHIIPKFVFDYIKNTSIAKMNFRNPMKNINIPLQDGDKTPLLCLNCENLFSKRENAFKKGIFANFQENGFTNIIPYSENDYYFIASVNWRTLYLDLLSWQEDKSISEKSIKILQQSELMMREYLLGNKAELTTFKQYLFFIDDISEAEQGIAELKPQSFLRRSGFGYTFISEEQGIYLTFCNLAGILAVTIYKNDCNVEKWFNCELSNIKGKFNPPQKVESVLWGEIFRYIEEINQIKLSSTQEEKIVKKMNDDIQNFKNSGFAKEYLKDKNIKVKK